MKTAIHRVRREFPFLMLVLAITASSIPTRVNADLMTIYWEGTIESVTLFDQGSALEGVVAGAPISGSLVFESNQTNGHWFVTGSTSGEHYGYADPLTQSMHIAAFDWEIIGGKVSLLNSSPGPRQAFDLFTSESISRSESFPHHVGPFEAGFALIDNSVPVTLFDSTEIQNANLDLDQVTSGSGLLTTRRWNTSGDIVEGYYIWFDINTASFSIIPEPSFCFLMIGALGIALLVRKTRKR